MIDEENDIQEDIKIIAFKVGMTIYELLQFIKSEFKGSIAYNCDISFMYHFFNECDKEVFNEYINGYLQNFNNTNNINSFENNKIYFKEFYDSYRVMNKLCGEVDDDWMKWF